MLASWFLLQLWHYKNGVSPTTDGTPILIEISEKQITYFNIHKSKTKSSSFSPCKSLFIYPLLFITIETARKISAMPSASCIEICSPRIRTPRATAVTGSKAPKRAV